MSSANIINFTDVFRQLVNEHENDTLRFEEFTSEFTEAFLRRARKTENRDSDRIELPPIPAEVQPLDCDFRPAGKPFAVMVRNISSNGIGLMFGEDTQCKYLQLQVDTPSGKNLKTVIEVKHCTEKGIMIGGTAVTDLRLC